MLYKSFVRHNGGVIPYVLYKFVFWSISRVWTRSNFSSSFKSNMHWTINRLLHLNMCMGRWESLVDMNWYRQCLHALTMRDEILMRKKVIAGRGEETHARTHSKHIKSKRKCQGRKKLRVKLTNQMQTHSTYWQKILRSARHGRVFWLCSTFALCVEYKQSIYYTIIEFEHSIYQLTVLFWRPCIQRMLVW